MCREEFNLALELSAVHLELYYSTLHLVVVVVVVVVVEPQTTTQKLQSQL